jgi:hypothetical protein
VPKWEDSNRLRWSVKNVVRPRRSGSTDRWGSPG